MHFDDGKNPSNIETTFIPNRPLLRPMAPNSLTVKSAMGTPPKRVSATSKVPLYTPNEPDEPFQTKVRSHRSRLVEREERMGSWVNSGLYSEDLVTGVRPNAVMPQQDAFPPNGYPAMFYAIPYYVQPDGRSYAAGQPVCMPSPGQPEAAPVPQMTEPQAATATHAVAPQSVCPARDQGQNAGPQREEAEEEALQSKVRMVMDAISEEASSQHNHSLHAQTNAPVINDDEPEDEEEDAIPTEKMAMPVPISFSEMHFAPRKRRVWPLVLVSIMAVLVVAVVALWEFGYRFPWPAGASIGAFFASNETVSESNAVHSFTASATEGDVPANVRFTVVTDMSVDQLGLIDDSGETINAAITSQPQGDLRKWHVITSFRDSYQGTIRPYLRDVEGFWTDGGSGIAVNFK